MSHVWNLLQTPQYAHLNSVFQILPISTGQYINNVALPVSNQDLQTDLDFIDNFIHNGGVILGWQNQYSTAQKPYAIGGGVFVGVTPANQKTQVQNHLMQLKLQYPAPAALPAQRPAPAPRAAQRPQPAQNNLFNQTPTVATPAIIQASNTLVQNMKAADTQSFLPNTNFIVRKGNINNTFKVAFRTPAEANRFYQRIKNGLGFRDTTYFGNGEKYPMDANGNVDNNGQYRYIVRFEMTQNQDALDYLRRMNVADCENLYQAIMGTAPNLRP